MWDVIWIEFIIIFILFIVLIAINMILLSIKLKKVDEKICEEEYDNALTIIQKNKNSKFNKKNVNLAFIEKEMMVYCFTNNRQNFDIAIKKLYESNIYRYKAEFWNVMFYFMNEKENPELEKLLENYKIKYQRYGGLITYLNTLYYAKQGNVETAKQNYELIAKKIKTKPLKKYIGSILL